MWHARRKVAQAELTCSIAPVFADTSICVSAKLPMNMAAVGTHVTAQAKEMGERCAITRGGTEDLRGTWWGPTEVRGGPEALNWKGSYDSSRSVSERTVRRFALLAVWAARLRADSVRLLAVISS